jgi:hypothetical protein
MVLMDINKLGRAQVLRISFVLAAFLRLTKVLGYATTGSQERLPLLFNRTVIKRSDGNSRVRSNGIPSGDGGYGQSTIEPAPLYLMTVPKGTSHAKEPIKRSPYD